MMTTWLILLTGTVRPETVLLRRPERASVLQNRPAYLAFAIAKWKPFLFRASMVYAEHANAGGRDRWGRTHADREACRFTERLAARRLGRVRPSGARGPHRDGAEDRRGRRAGLRHPGRRTGTEHRPPLATDRGHS